MTRTIKAFQFWVKPIDGPTTPVRAAVSANTTGQKTFEFTHSGRTYLAQDLAWENRRGLLTGTIYLVRSNNLPAAIRDGHAEPLPISEETDLGEPMCFAFHPEVGAAMIQYAHTGPRHSVMVDVLGRLCPDVPVAVEPVIRRDMLEKLRQKKFFRGIEFALSDPKGVQQLRTLGGSVGNAISMLEDIGGVSVRIEISMGHTLGQGLVLDTTRRLAEKLAKIGAQEVNGHAGVRAIKVKGSDGEDAPVEELDLLKAREPVPLDVGESHRSIDTVDACRKLSTALNERLSELRIQSGAD